MSFSKPPKPNSPPPSADKGNQDSRPQLTKVLEFSDAELDNFYRPVAQALELFTMTSNMRSFKESELLRRGMRQMRSKIVLYHLLLCLAFHDILELLNSGKLHTPEECTGGDSQCSCQDGCQSWFQVGQPLMTEAIEPSIVLAEKMRSLVEDAIGSFIGSAWEKEDAKNLVTEMLFLLDMSDLFAGNVKELVLTFVDAVEGAVLWPVKKEEKVVKDNSSG